MASAEETQLYARFCELRKDGQSDRNAARLIVNELQRAGRKEMSVPAVLRRMQRYEEALKKAAAEMQKLNDYLGSMLNFSL